MNVSIYTVFRVVNETAKYFRISPLNKLPEHMSWDKFKYVLKLLETHIKNSR